jgi:hypothetical protein
LFFYEYEEKASIASTGVQTADRAASSDMAFRSLSQPMALSKDEYLDFKLCYSLSNFDTLYVTMNEKSNISSGQKKHIILCKQLETLGEGI